MLFNVKDPSVILTLRVRDNTSLTLRPGVNVWKLYASTRLTGHGLFLVLSVLTLGRISGTVYSYVEHRLRRTSGLVE